MLSLVLFNVCRSTVFAFAAPIGEETTVDDSDNSIGISPAPHPGTAVHCTGPSTTLFDTSMFEDATPSRSSFTSVIGTGKHVLCIQSEKVPVSCLPIIFSKGDVPVTVAARTHHCL